MLTDNLPKSQEFSSLTLKEKKILNNQADKKFQLLLSQIPDFAFNNNTVPFFGNFVFLNRFKNYIQLEKTFKDFANFNRGDNIQYSNFDILENMIDSNLVGKLSFLHYNDLLNNPGFARIKANNTPPDESTIRKVLDKAEVQNITELKKVMNSLLAKNTKHEGPR